MEIIRPRSVFIKFGNELQTDVEITSGSILPNVTLFPTNWFRFNIFNYIKSILTMNDSH